MADSSKILILGSAQGALPTLFSKLRTFNSKHGPFDAVFCLGDFFSPAGPEGNERLEELLGGNIDIPAPTYILSSPTVPPPPAVLSKALESGSAIGTLGPNLSLLDGKGKFTIPGRGVHVVFSTGAEPVSVADMDPTTATHLLLTHSHPSTALSTLPSPASGTDADLLLKHLKPRYAFSGASGTFLEREPFGWEGEGGEMDWTRCVALGALGGEGGKKQRWYYAFTISPTVPPPPPPPKHTSNPYLAPPPDTSNNAADSTPLPTNGSVSSIPSSVKRKFDAIAQEEKSLDYRWGGKGQNVKREKIDHTGKPPAGYKCRICDSSEHFIQVCPQKLQRDKDRASGDTGEKPPEGYKCRKCGSTEHFVRSCPEATQMGDTGGGLPPEGYMCRGCGGTKHYFKDCEVAARGRNERGHGHARKEIGPGECWFCLSNPQVTKHLIVSIGSETYLTLPRGSLLPPLASSPNALPGGGHVLIIPISHFPTLLSLPPDSSLPIISEIESYKSSLRAFFRTKDCGAVVWEIGRLSGRGGHAHVQVVPVPLSLGDKVEEAFRKEGEETGVEWEEEADGAMEKALQSGGNYLRVELPNGKTLVHSIRPGPPFNLQFGRMVLAKLLGVTDRLDWKACGETEDEEKEAAQRFKAAFAAFDPTLQ